MQLSHGLYIESGFCEFPSHPVISTHLHYLLPLSFSHVDSYGVQVLLHKTPAVALIEGRYSGTEKRQGVERVHYHPRFQQVSRFGNCKLQKRNLQGQNNI